ncbi:MAG: RHS repeat-associated core domain-containing protein, partial [Sedimenticola sp.]
MSCKISTGTGFGREIRSGYLNSGWDDNNRWWADINGDGKGDFCRMVWVSPGRYQMDCKVSSGNSFGSEVGTGVIDVGYESNRWWADINGDGLSDFCRLVGSRNQVNCKVSTGTGFGQEIRTGVIDAGYEGHRWWADANGDGLSDYCRLVGGAGNYRVHCKSSTGNGFGSEISTGVIDPGYDHSRWWADVNGDGAADYVRLVGGSGKYRVTAKSTTQKPTLVSSITTGLGDQARITYKPLNDGSVHSIGKGAAYPERDIQGPLHVVLQAKRDNGLGGDITTRYNYGGARVHLHGRGFLGFEWMKAADTQTGITTTTTYRQDFPYTGKVAATEQRQANGKLLGRTTATWAKKTQHGGKTHFPYISRSVDAQYQLDSHHISTTTTDSQYDGYGNPTRITAATTDGGEQVVKESLNQYINNTDRWHLGRLTRASVTHTTDQGSLTKTSAFAYNANGLLSQEIVEPDKPALRLVTDTTYDRFGNKIKTTTHGNGVAPRTTTTTYTTDGRFPASTTNALGHTETYTYDPLHGVMTTLRGPNGLTTHWQYDRFGRKTREDRADGTWSTITRGFCQHGDCPQDAPWNAALVTTTQSAGSTPITTYADRLGRIIREQSVGFDGTPIYQDTQYNALGQIERVSLPHFAGEASYWTTNTYDLLGRVIRTDSQQSNGTTRTTQISHRGRTTVTTDPLGHQKTTIKNLLGKVARVEQEEHTWVNYTYDPTGNLTRTDSNGSITELSYDLRGRKTAMNDPNMGRWQYAYNAYGELTSQTDAKGQTVTMAYDPLGRMIKRTEPEGTTTWQYDTAAHGIGKLHQVTGPDGYTKIHTYDSLGRSQRTEQQAGGTTLAHQLEYDQYGRINKETRPNGFILTKHYNAQGYLQAIQAPKAQIDDYNWEHLEVLLDAALSSSIEALEKAQYYGAKAAEYRAQVTRYRKLAAIHAYSGNAEVLEALRGAAESLDAYAETFMQRAQYYQDLSKEYWALVVKYVNLARTEQENSQQHWALANKYYYYYRLCISIAANNQLMGEEALQQAQQPDSAVNLLDSSLTDIAAYYTRKAEESVAMAAALQEKADWYTRQAESNKSSTGAAHYQAMYDDGQGEGGQVTFWRAIARDATGRLTQHIAGNGLITQNHYDQASGQLHATLTGFNFSADVRHISYRYDQANNLLNRTDERTGFYEQFSYDRLERLTHTSVYGRIGTIDYHYDVSQTYDAQGNITHKSDVGDYQYDPNRSQQLTSAGTKHIGYQYDANGNITQGGGRSFQWASYNKPTRLQKGNSTVSFNYSAEHNRYRKVTRISGETITTDYFEKLYEKETSQQAIDHKHHIYADGQLVAIHIEHQQGGADETRYLHYDALGSIDTITDGKGKVIERMSYDPWGKRRGGDWRIDDPLNATQFHRALFTNRGFTGHEHIDELNLIHMNGRVYDPELGRFLSADPTMQFPYSTQGYNRYAYVQNNPLKYTDPSGYWADGDMSNVPGFSEGETIRYNDFSGFGGWTWDDEDFYDPYGVNTNDYANFNVSGYGPLNSMTYGPSSGVSFGDGLNGIETVRIFGLTDKQKDSYSSYYSGLLGSMGVTNGSVSAARTSVFSNQAVGSAFSYLFG